MTAKDYIRWIRSKVGHEKIILTFAGGCVFNEEGKVLLQRRGDSNKWGFPGGAIEPGETPEMAAIREVKEETGLDVSVGRLIGVYTDLDMTYPNGDQAQSIVIAYELQVISGELVCDQNETLELNYFSEEEKPHLFTGSHEALWNDIFPNHKDRRFTSVEKIIAACGNDCAACPRYVKHPYEKTADELHHTAELWMKIGYRDHIVTNEEISCTGCKPENWCRYRVIECCTEKGISTCAACQDYPCDKIRECFEVTKSFEPKCREVCTVEEYEQLKKAFFEKEKNLCSKR